MKERAREQKNEGEEGRESERIKEGTVLKSKKTNKKNIKRAITQIFHKMATDNKQ